MLPMQPRRRNSAPVVARLRCHDDPGNSQFTDSFGLTLASAQSVHNPGTVSASCTASDATLHTHAGVTSISNHSAPCLVWLRLGVGRGKGGVPKEDT